MLIQIQNELNLTPKVCAKCGGNCCKRIPGTTEPMQWGPDSATRISRLADAFRSGMWSIDWWEGDTQEDGDLERVEYVRPATISAHRIKDASWGGACVFLSQTGCTLSATDRPSQCLGLIASKNGTNCKEPLGKRGYAEMWRDHQGEIYDAYQLAIVEATR